LFLPADRAFIDQLPDQVEYLQIADSLLAGDGFVVVDERYPTPQALLAQRMPGYPVLLAACAGAVEIARVLQALVETSTVLATFLLARRWLTSGASLLAAALVALNPFLIYFSNLLLSETAYTAILTWGMVGLARPGQRGRFWWLGMAALVLGVYIRPSGAGLAIVLGLVSVFIHGRHPFAVHSRWPLPVGMTTLLMLVVVLLPWAVRNRIVLGEWVWLTTNHGITLYDGWHIDNTTGGSDQSFVARMPQLGLMNETERDAYLKQKAFAALREQPGRSVLLALKKMGRTWSPIPLSQTDRPIYLLAGLVYTLPVFALALAALFATELPRHAKAFLLAPAAYLTLVHVASVGSVRYRLPAEPALAILAAAGLAAALASLSYWRARRTANLEEAGGSNPPGRGFEVITGADKP
jgi:4-amino-4-deoxy-L-arabinose transferase-like glycosyltransferase